MALQLLTSSIFNFSNYTGRVPVFFLTRKLLSSFTLSLLISCVAFAQSGELNLPPDKKYENAVLGFKNEERMQVNSIELFADSLIYQSNGSFKSHAYDKIRYIQVKDATFAGSGAIVGAGIMLFASLVTAIDISNSPSRQFKSDPGLRIIGLTAGGAGVGALIGMIFKRPRKYYVHYE